MKDKKMHFTLQSELASHASTLNSLLDFQAVRDSTKIEVTLQARLTISKSMPRLLRIMRMFDHSVEVDILIFAKRSKRASRLRFRHAKAMKSSAGVSLTRAHPARKETAAPGCTRVPSRRCFLARIGIQCGVADNNAQFYTGQD